MRRLGGHRQDTYHHQGCPLARRRRDRPEKLLPSPSEGPRVGVEKLTSQLARGELLKWALSQDASWEHRSQD